MRPKDPVLTRQHPWIWYNLAPLLTIVLLITGFVYRQGREDSKMDTLQLTMDELSDRFHEISPLAKSRGEVLRNHEYRIERVEDHDKIPHTVPPGIPDPEIEDLAWPMAFIGNELGTEIRR